MRDWCTGVVLRKSMVDAAGDGFVDRLGGWRAGTAASRGRSHRSLVDAAGACAGRAATRGLRSTRLKIFGRCGGPCAYIAASRGLRLRRASIFGRCGG
jgi:hypothetical protein